MRLALPILVALAGAAHADDGAAPGAGAAEPDDPIVPDPRARRMAAEANLEPVRRREGLAVGLAVGGSMQVGFGEELAEASRSGGSFNLRVGTSASDQLAWFVELFGAAGPNNEREDPVKFHTVLGLGAQYFLLETLWLRAGLGWSSLQIGDDRLDGIGSIAGGGLDFLRRGRFALSGNLAFVSSLYRAGFLTAVTTQLGLTWY